MSKKSLINFGVPTKTNSDVKKLVNKITIWINDRLVKLIGYDQTKQILVTEVSCSDQDCVPIECLIVIFDNDYNKDDLSNNDLPYIGKKWVGKILKPLIEVDIEDVEQLDLPIEWNNLEEYNNTKMKHDGNYLEALISMQEKDQWLMV